MKNNIRDTIVEIRLHIVENVLKNRTEMAIGNGESNRTMLSEFCSQQLKIGILLTFEFNRISLRATPSMLQSIFGANRIISRISNIQRAAMLLFVESHPR